MVCINILVTALLGSSLATALPKPQFPGFPRPGGGSGFPSFPGSGGGTGGGFPSFPGSGGSGGNTQNDINNGVCRSVSVIYARGTGEPGNVGTLTGPSFFSALKSALGADNVAVQGVDYPASTAGNAQLGRPGAGPMKAAAEKALAQCPTTKLVLSGYSQGAMVVHATADQLSADTASKVSAVVLFGDPFNGRPLTGIPASKVKTFCHTGDTVCPAGSPKAGSGSHINYNQDAAAAAQFVQSKL